MAGPAATCNAGYTFWVVVRWFRGVGRHPRVKEYAGRAVDLRRLRKI